MERGNLLNRAIIIIVMIIFFIIVAISVILTILKGQPVEPKITSTESNNTMPQEEVAVREYNQFKFSHISNQQIANIYFNDYITRMDENIEDAYELLDETYREKKFGNVESYKKYIDRIGDERYELKMTQYKIKEYDGYRQIICVDQKGNYYIFHESAVMQYKVFLDSYTVEIQAIKEEYEGLTIKNKIIYCINNFVDAIQTNNYQYAYSVLSNDFKNNYFKTIQEFQTYIKQIINENTSVICNNFRNQGELYLMDIQLKGSQETETIKTIIMKLNEGIDFELSFNI